MKILKGLINIIISNYNYGNYNQNKQIFITILHGLTFIFSECLYFLNIRITRICIFPEFNTTDISFVDKVQYYLFI